MREYQTFIVEYIAQVDGRRFKTSVRISAYDKADAIKRAKKNNPIFVEASGVVTVK